MLYIYCINYNFREPIYTMTIIGENMFATGDDDGVVKCKTHLYHFLFCFRCIIILVYKYFKYGILDKKEIHLCFH